MDPELEGVLTLPQFPLVLLPDEAWELNARVRDLIEQSDLPAGIAPGQAIGPLLVNPQPLALQIIRALHDLQGIPETSIMVCEAECWFLERRFRHNDREPAARSLLLKIHELIMEFHPEFTSMESAQEVVDGDRSYSEALSALKDANKNAGENPPEDTGTGEGAGDLPLPAE